MEQDISYESTNINSKWLENIYENIKNLEALERVAREGCASLIDYLKIPYDMRPIEIGEAMYKTLKFMVTELGLLIDDLKPILQDKCDKYKEKLDGLKSILNKRNRFIIDITSARNNRAVSVKPTPYFYETLDIITEIKVEIISEPEVSGILYVKKGEALNPWH